MRGHDDRVEALAFHPEGKSLATGGRDKRIRIWDPAGGKEMGDYPEPASVLALAFHPEGKPFASGGDDGTVRLWDVK